MDRSDVAYLVTVTRTQDDYGVFRETEKRRRVFVQVDSVTRSEFFEGGRNGLNPEFRFTMFFADYHDEEVLIYKDRAYAIYRTYIGRNDTIELYCERKGGTNGKAQQ